MKKLFYYYENQNFDEILVLTRQIYHDFLDVANLLSEMCFFLPEKVELCD